MMTETQDSVVVLAGWFQFGAGECIVHDRVESRMLLWCKSGKGVIQVNGDSQTLVPGDWIFLPWRRRLVYIADREDPLLVGGIHIIPHHRSGTEVSFNVDHFASKRLPENPSRYDWTQPLLKKTLRGHFGEDDRLVLLATYTVERYQNEKPDVETMRHAAGLIVNELQFTAELHRIAVRPLSGQSHRMQEYVRTHLASALTVEKLASVAGCSLIGVHRQFRKYAGMSPGRWIAQKRIQRASQLLRTTNLPIGEIGRQVGLSDPLHFSRFFKRKAGLSPSAYRDSRRFLVR